MEKISQQVAIFSGLGDRVKLLKLTTLVWKYYGLTPHVLNVGWKDGEDFDTKYIRLIKETKDITKLGPTAIMGTSAGGSMAFNIFMELWPGINSAINVCGRLKKGDENDFREKTQTSQAFAKSVAMFEEKIPKLTQEQKQRMLIIRSRIYDECVPKETSEVKGIKQIELPIPGHGLCISAEVTIFAERDIFKFIDYNMRND
jgi:hypothetical protein